MVTENEVVLFLKTKGIDLDKTDPARPITNEDIEAAILKNHKSQYFLKVILPTLTPLVIEGFIGWEQFYTDLISMIGKSNVIRYTNHTFSDERYKHTHLTYYLLKRGVVTWEYFKENIQFFLDIYLSYDFSSSQFAMHFQEILVKRIINLEQFARGVETIRNESGYNRGFQGLGAISKDILAGRLGWEEAIKGILKIEQFLNTAEEKKAVLNHFFINAILYVEIDNKSFKYLIKKLRAVKDYCKGSETMTYESLGKLKELFLRFGLELFDSLIIPTLKTQQVGAFMCFESYGKLERAILSKKDIKILLKIQNKRKLKTNNFLQAILVRGLDAELIQPPLER